jgi:hypothetical protein
MTNRFSSESNFLYNKFKIKYKLRRSWNGGEGEKWGIINMKESPGIR